MLWKLPEIQGQQETRAQFIMNCQTASAPIGIMMQAL